MYICSNIKSEKIAHAIPEFLTPILEKLEVCLAGGAGRRFFGTSDNDDYDLFVIPDKIEKDKTKDFLEGALLILGFDKKFQCEKDELRSFVREDVKVQLIDINGITYSSPQDLINSFDINAGRFAYHKKKLIFDKAALRDVHRKHISLNKLTYPIATLKRIGRYAGKGYKNTFAAQDFVRMLTEMVVAKEEISDIVYLD